MEVSICEAEQGEVMGEDKDSRSVEYLMNYYENSRQQGGMMTKASSETTSSYVFKGDSFCMIASISGEKQLCQDVFRMDEDLEKKGEK